MTKILLFPLLVYAAAGLLLSLTVHLLAYAGLRLGGTALFAALHIGIFPLWIPVVILATKMTQASPRNEFWRIATSGCPIWMKRMMYGFFAYAVFNFILFILLAFLTGQSHKTTSTLDPLAWRGFSGHWMLFYSAGLTVTVTAYNRGLANLQRRCPKGHVIPYSAHFCSTCGLPTEDKPS